MCFSKQERRGIYEYLRIFLSKWNHRKIAEVRRNRAFAHGNFATQKCLGYMSYFLWKYDTISMSCKAWQSSQQIWQGVLERSWETNGKLHDFSLEGGVRWNCKQWFVWIIVWIPQDIEGVKVGNTILEEVKMLKFYVRYLWKLSKKTENK